MVLSSNSKDEHVSLAAGLLVAFRWIKKDVDAATEVVPRAGIDRNLKAPSFCEFKHIEPFVMRRFVGVESLDISRIHVHPIQRGFAVLVEPEGTVVIGWWGV